ncbi:hypothetical protein KCU65_g106, partial [Aureobasidium melanogenum]
MTGQDMKCVREQTCSSVPSGKKDIQHLITELSRILNLSSVTFDNGLDISVCPCVHNLAGSIELGVGNKKIHDAQTVAIGHLMLGKIECALEVISFTIVSGTLGTNTLTEQKL